MAAMFDRERENTEAQMAQEKLERKKYEEKVQQLEENLEEQKRMSKEHKREAGRRRTLFDDEMAQVKAAHARERRIWEEDLERERATVRALKDSMTSNSTAHLTLESTNAALRIELQSVQDQLKGKDARIAEVEAALAQQQAAVGELEAELREAESLRRKLHNEVQELRGNIRVFARIRPALPQQSGSALATIRLPNPREAREIEVLSAGESATGTATMRSFGFAFDRVFGPNATQMDVFDEVQHLMQSVLDGYNVSREQRRRRGCETGAFITNLTSLFPSWPSPYRPASLPTAKRAPERHTPSRALGCPTRTSTWPRARRATLVPV